MTAVGASLGDNSLNMVENVQELRIGAELKQITVIQS